MHPLVSSNDVKRLVRFFRGESIPLYWARNPRETNFGDELTALIIPTLTGRGVHWSPLDRGCLVGAGSVVSWLPVEESRQPRVVWGSGLMHEESQVELSSDFVVSVRGELTRERLRGSRSDSAISLGDPGLLTSEAFPLDQISSTHEILLIPHLVDRQSEGVAEILSVIPNIKVLDVATDPVTLCARISQAKLVISSALHPLIVADSYGVPNIWLKLSNKIHGGYFKFHDYYSVFGQKPMPLTITDLLNSFESTQARVISEYERPMIESIKADVKASLDQALGIMGFPRF